MQIRRSSFLVFVVLVWCFSPVFGQTGFVHQQKMTLVNGSGQEIHLQGINLGGWLSWEGWMWGGGFDSQTTVEKHVRKASDSLYALEFRDSIYNYFIQQKDLLKIKELGLNCVRIPFNYRLLEHSSTDEELNFKQLDSVINWCKHAGLYAILDMHALPGGQNKYFNCDPELVSLWDSPEHQEKAVRLWAAIANRYQNDTIVAAYDLMNEPDHKVNDSVLNMYKRLISAVRSVDQNHLLIIEGNGFAREFNFFPKQLDTNMMFSFHFYPWYQSPAKRLKTLLNYANLSKYFQVPFWCGEWGEDERTELFRNRNGLMDPQYEFVGSAFWTWKNVKYRKRPVLNKIQVSKDVGLVMNGYKPLETQDGKAVLREFLREMNIDEVKTNPELVRMLKSLTDGTKILKL